MKITEWNIRHGGSNERIPKILSSLQSHDADIIVLTEFRSERLDLLLEGLRRLGYTDFISSNPGPNTNGIFIASRCHLGQIDSKYVSEGVKHRWLEVDVADYGFKLLGIHIPGASDKWGKKAFWESVIDYARDHTDEKVIMM